MYTGECILLIEKYSSNDSKYDATIHWETHSHLSECREPLFRLGPIRLHLLGCLLSASPAPVIHFLICVLVIVTQRTHTSAIHKHAQCTSQRYMQNNHFKIAQTTEKKMFSMFSNLPFGLPVSFSLLTLCFTDRRTSVVYISIRGSLAFLNRERQILTFRDSFFLLLLWTHKGIHC